MKRLFSKTASLFLEIGESAREKLCALGEKFAGDKRHLRISVSGGGCHGFQYNFALAADYDPSTDILVNESERELPVIVDKRSAEFIGRGSRLVYDRISKQSPLLGQQFAIVENPAADAGCGCGVSFGLKTE